MQDLLKPIKTESLKEVFVARFEELIISGKLSIGQKLPSERELAMQLNVSRPVVHEGLVELAVKGLVKLKPRVGAVVSDYRKEGSPEILNSIFNYQNGHLDHKILSSILSSRMLIEIETSRLAAIKRTDEQLERLKEILMLEEEIPHKDTAGVVELDFEFHHCVAMASDNMMYPLLLNALKKIYTNLSTTFYADVSVVAIVFSFHKELVEAIEKKNEKLSIDIMTKILSHGEDQLNKRLNIENQEGL